MKFEIFTRKDGRTGIRLIGNNREIVMAGEGYHSEGNARLRLQAHQGGSEGCAHCGHQAHSGGVGQRRGVSP